MDTCVCPSVHVWTETKKHTSYDHLCPSAHVWTVVLTNTTSVAIFWYSWYFCGYFVYLQPHKTDSHTGKKTPKFMDKSSHKTPVLWVWTYRRSHTKPNSHTGKRHPNLWTKVATRHRFVGPSVRPSVRPSVCLSVCHTFLTMFPSSYHHEIVSNYYQWQKWRPCKRSRSKVKVTEVNTQLSRFRTVTPVWIHIWWWNDAQSLMLIRRGALLFCHTALKIVEFDPNWAFPGCNSSLNSPMATKWCTKLEVA